jgi:DNA-binding transcriptional regulator YiaG
MSIIYQIAEEFKAILDERDALLERVAELESSMDNRSKLSPNEVKEIREAHKNGMTQKDLADNYGVNPATISRTVRHIYN